VNISSDISRKFIRFSLVGVANTAVDWLVFFLLVSRYPLFSSAEVLAKSASFIAAVVVSFFLNSLWTFKDEVSRGRELGSGFFDSARLGRFFATSLVGLGVNTLFFSLATQALSSLPEFQSRILSLAAATAASLVWNFVVNLKWTFKAERSSKMEVWDKAALGVVLLTFLVAVFSAATDSITTDEIPHISAGYSYLTSQRMLLNLEHPPLAKILAAIPLTTLNLNTPSPDAVAEEVKSGGLPSWMIQWKWGYQFVFSQKISPETIVFLARIPMVLLFILTAWFVYLLGKEIFGSKAGLVALLLLSFSPNFLAHGRLVTTDVGATFGFVSTIYFLYRYLMKGRKRRDLIWTGIFLGIANLLKFSGLFLYPIIGILAFLVFAKSRNLWPAFKEAFKVSAPVFLLGFLVTILGYYLIFPKDVCCRDSHLDSLLLSGYYQYAGDAVPVADSLGARPILNYLVGVGAVATRIAPGNSPFVLGNVSSSAWLYFFPLSFLFKEPLPTMLGSLLALWFVLNAFLKKRSRISVLVLVVPALIYSLSAVLSKFNLGIRHILPAFPFLYVLIGGAAAYLVSRFRRAVWVIVPLILWLVFGTLLSFPNYLAYFNEIQTLTGLEKYEIFIDSNLDWGQNLIRLADFVKETGIEKIKVNYWLDADPTRAYLPEAIDWGGGFDSTIEWYAVGSTQFQFAKMQKEDPFLFLRSKEPVKIVSDGILVYRITK
jgi:putative flippase GtrA